MRSLYRFYTSLAAVQSLPPRDKRKKKAENAVRSPPIGFLLFDCFNDDAEVIVICDVGEV